MLLVVTDDRFSDHEAGPSHPERPGRLTAALDGIRLADVAEAVTWRSPRSASDQEITAVHEPGYLARMNEFSAAGGGRLDADTSMGPMSLEVARLAAGAVLTAVDELASSEEFRAGYCVVRPPGHHATPDRAMGFCLFNSVAIAARSITARGQKVAIVDFDAHHGNGTQDAFFDDPAVLYASIHQSPLYPGSGDLTETGIGAGVGTTINVPLPPGATGDVALRALDGVIGPAVDSFDPDWLLVSAGFDGHRDDPLAQLMFSAGDIADLMGRLLQLVAPGRVVAALEGGYDLPAIRLSSAALVGCLTDTPCRTEESTSGGPGADIVESARRLHIDEGRDHV